MRNESHRSKLATLMHYVDKWRVRVGSREAVAVAIVEAHTKNGMADITGIRFETQGDPFTLAKNAADRIYRWLDDKTKDTNYMPANFEESILMAMPEDLRYAYACETMRPLGYSPRKFIYCVGESPLSPIERAMSISKEGADALQAVMALNGDTSNAALHAAHKELSESIGTSRAARAAIEKMMEERNLEVPND